MSVEKPSGLKINDITFRDRPENPEIKDQQVTELEQRPIRPKPDLYNGLFQEH